MKSFEVASLAFAAQRRLLGRKQHANRLDLQPVVTSRQFDLKGYFQRKRTGHFAIDECRQRGDLAGRRLEDQLVVNLQQHASLKPSGGKRPIDQDHGPLDQIGSRTLDDRVDRGPLGQVPRPAGG